MIKILSTRVTTDVTAELLIIQDLKDHLNITHTDDDEYLNRLIRSTRKRIENITGHAIGTQRREIIMELEGDVILPGLPAKSLVTIEQFDNSVYTAADTSSYALLGNYFKTYGCSTWRVVYECGYSTAVEMPDDIMMAWLNECAYRYINRGDIKASGDYDTETFNLLKPYIDLTWL